MSETPLVRRTAGPPATSVTKSPPGPVSASFRVSGEKAGVSAKKRVYSETCPPCGLIT